MISSIFYFADTEQEYLDNFNRRQVKPYTIVFCKDTHSVWKNGVRYGGSTSAETQSQISEIIDRDVAPLIAQLEQAITQANEALDRAEGRVDEISAGFEDSMRQISAQIDEEKQRLTDKVNELDEQVTQSVGDILDDYQNLVDNLDENISNWFDKVAAGEIVHTDGWNEALKAYLTAVETVEVDPETGETTVKTSNLIQDVNGLKSDVQEITKDGDGKIAVAKSEVIQKASEIVSQVTGVTVADDGTVDTTNVSLQQQITNEGNARAELSTKWANADADTKKVLEWMYSGLTTEAGDDKTFTQLVAAAQGVDHSAISNITNLVEKVENEDGTFSYRAKSALTSAVDNALSGFISNTSSDYASAQFFAELNSDIAGLKASTGDASALEGIVTKDSFASELKAVASKDWAETTMATKLRVPKTYSNGAPMYDTQGNIIYEDVADVLGAMRTTIDVLDGGPQVTNSVDARVNDAISTFEQQVTGEAASTTAVNKLGPALSGLVSKVTGDTSQADIVSKINGMSAGLITTANLDSAVAGLVAENANSSLKSSIYSKIDAAKDEARSGMVANSTAGAAAIFAKANAQGSEIQLSADKINFTGSANFENAVKAVDLEIENTLTVGDVEDKVTEILESGDAAFSGDVYASSLTAGDTTDLHIVTSANQLQFVNGDTVVGRFVVDGYGLQLFILNDQGVEYKIDWDNWKSVGNISFTPVHVYSFSYSSPSSSYPQGIIRNDTIIYKDQDGNYKHSAAAIASTLTGFKCYVRDSEYGERDVDDYNYVVHMKCQVFTDTAGSDVLQCAYPVRVYRYKEVSIEGNAMYDTGNYVYYTTEMVPKNDNSHLNISEPVGSWPTFSSSEGYAYYNPVENDWYNCNVSYTELKEIYLTKRDSFSFEAVCDYATHEDNHVFRTNYEYTDGEASMKIFSGSSVEQLVTKNKQYLVPVREYVEYYCGH